MADTAYSQELLGRAAKIKLLLLDCDGVMTDGNIYFLPDGQGGIFETKGFNSQDGIALRWAKSVGIEIGIISGRRSAAVEERARSIGMKYLYQGRTDKMPLFEEILEDSGLEPEQVAFVGDDVTDLPLLMRVGLAAAPLNSRPEAGDLGANLLASGQGIWPTLVGETGESRTPRLAPKLQLNRPISGDVGSL